MSEDSRSTKLRKRYYVVNPGSGDSDDAKDDYRHYSRPQQHRPSPSQPNLLTTDLARPPLSPDSTPSPSTPPPPTHAPSSSLDHPKPLPIPDPDPVPPATSRKGKFLQTLKAPFGSRPLRSAAPDPNSPRRPRTVSLPISPLFSFYLIITPKSPTTAAPDSYTSTTTPSEKLIFVTSDSERYVTVDVSGARTAIQIRELILTKVCSLLSLNPLLPHPPLKATHLRRRREPPILDLSNRDWCICHGRGFDQRSPLGALPRSR